MRPVLLCCITIRPHPPVAVRYPRSAATAISSPSNLSFLQTLHRGHPRLVRNRWASSLAREARIIPARSPRQSRSPPSASLVLGQAPTPRTRVWAGEVKINGEGGLSGDPIDQDPPGVGKDQLPQHSTSGRRLRRNRISTSQRLPRIPGPRGSLHLTLGGPRLQHQLSGTAIGHSEVMV